MKITAILILATCLQVSANGYAQTITLTEQNASLQKVFKEIKKQTGYNFLYTWELVEQAGKVDIELHHASLSQALEQCLQNKQLTYIIVEKTVVIKQKENTADLAIQSLPPIVIKGKITNEKGEPLSGASIKIKNSNSGTTTDANGEFTISLHENGVLNVSYVGYQTQEIALKGETQIAIALQPVNGQMNDVVVIAYGTQKRNSLTSAVSTLQGTDVAAKPVVNLSNDLAGRMSGLIVTQGSGEPGNDGAGIFIRGISTTGNNAPLVIVDGIPRDFTRLDPNSVETITVLKDAAAVAPYGVAGANGVILVTTKKGKIGAPTLSYNGYAGIQNPTRVPKMVNSYEFALMRNEANANDGNPVAYSDDQLQKYKDGTNPDGYPNSNPFRQIINSNRIVTSHNLSLSGGNERIKYFASAGYTSQQGMWSTTNLKKYNALLNLEAKATKTTTVALSINGWVEDDHYPTTNAYGIMMQAFRTPPVSPVYYSNGLWGGYIGSSLVGEIYHGGYQLNENNTLQTQISIEQQLPFIKGLSIKGLASYDPTTNFLKTWTTPIPFYTVDTTTSPYTYNKGTQGSSKAGLMENYTQNHAFTYQAYLNYHHTFGKHDVTALAVAESRNVKYAQFGAQRLNYNLDIDELNYGSSDPADISNSGYSTQATQLGYVYRVAYSYDGKYLFEASGRYDGNYYFGPGKKFGYFPAFSAGWRLSEEKFIRNNARWIDNLKIRGSWGESGNLAGAPFQYLSPYQLYSNSAFLGGAATQGLYEVSQGNPDITWEKAKKTDIGIDGSLWKGLLSFQVDYFYEIRSNMLVTPAVTVPAEYGIPLTQVNAGIMSNHGIEFQISSSHQFSRDLRLDISANFTYARNKLLKVFETSATFDNPNRKLTGRPLNTMFGYKALGYFQSQKSIDTSAVQPWGVVHLGDIQYADLNGDGKIDDNDQTVIGNPTTPEMQFGFIPRVSYKGFDLSLLFQGAAKTSIYLSGSTVYPFENSGSATKLEFQNHWTPDNTNALYPKLNGAPYGNNTEYSSWWVRNASYIRLKSFEFGYTIPVTITRNLKIQSVRFFASGQNLWTWTPHIREIVDPEVSEGSLRYYFQQQVFSFGLNVTF